MLLGSSRKGRKHLQFCGISFPQSKHNSFYTFFFFFFLGFSHSLCLFGFFPVSALGCIQHFCYSQSYNTLTCPRSLASWQFAVDWADLILKAIWLKKYLHVPHLFFKLLHRPFGPSQFCCGCLVLGK